MDNGFTDKIKGAATQAKGEVKEKIGKVTDDASLQVEGKYDQLKGKAQEKIGELKDKFSDKG